MENKDQENHKSNVVEQQVKFLVPGMRVAKDIMDIDGKILVSGGTELSPHTINRLKDWEIKTVLIIQETTANPLIVPEVQQFINTYNQSIDVVNRAFDAIRQTKEVPLELLVEANQEIQKTIPPGGNIIDQLYNLPSCDDYTFHHCVNVSVISALIARWLGYPDDIVNTISLVGLLHDIGKSQLPPNILNRTNLLPAPEYELYKKHANYGYELLKDNPNIPQSVKMGVMSHHEREDGTGYPYHLGSSKIHPYARIVAIADTYDEGLTINRDPSIVFSPYAALEKLRESISTLDAKATITFIDRMTNFLSGNVVALTDGRVGRVVFINKDAPSRSMVQLEDGQVLDLSETPDLQVFHLV